MQLPRDQVCACEASEERPGHVADWRVGIGDVRSSNIPGARGGDVRERGLHVTCGVLARSHRSATFHQYWPWHVSQTFVAAWLNPARSTLIAQNAVVGCYGRLSL